MVFMFRFIVFSSIACVGSGSMFRVYHSITSHHLHPYQHFTLLLDRPFSLLVLQRLKFSITMNKFAAVFFSPACNYCDVTSALR